MCIYFLNFSDDYHDVVLNWVDAFLSPIAVLLVASARISYTVFLFLVTTLGNASLFNVYQRATGFYYFVFVVNSYRVLCGRLNFILFESCLRIFLKSIFP